MVRALIIGTGDMAYGLCRQFCIHSPVTDSRSMDPEIGKSTVTTSPAYELAVTGLHISGDKTNFLETGVPYVDLYEGLAKADVVFLAIPSTALGSFVAKNMEYIKDRILVDCTNPVKPGQNLKSALETFYKSHSYDYGVSWVKTFNDLGALELITKKAVSHSKFSTTMCGSDSYAVNKVKEFAEQALGFNVKALPDPSYAEKMEQEQASIGKEWIHAFWITVIIHFCSYLYVSMRHHYGFGVSKDNMPSYSMNRAFGVTAITGFALTQLPGIFANLIRTFGGREARFPGVLLWSLNLRKHLGLCSFFVLCCHAILSCLLLSPAYHYYVGFIPDTGKLGIKAEVSFLFATFGFCLYGVCALASLPSVGSAMNFRQWDFVFGKLVWLALSGGVIHAALLGVDGWFQDSSSPKGMISTSFLSNIIPFFVVALKILQEILCRARIWAKHRARFMLDKENFRHESTFKSMRGLGTNHGSSDESESVEN